MDFDEFAAVYNAYAAQRDATFKDDWNRMRLLATFILQPHTRKGQKLTPEKLLPLPWDKERKLSRRSDKQQLTAAEQRRRMEDLVKKLGDELI